MHWLRDLELSLSSCDLIKVKTLVRKAHLLSVQYGELCHVPASETISYIASDLKGINDLRDITANIIEAYRDDLHELIIWAGTSDEPAN